MAIDGRQELAEKVEWEGGLDAALEYGLRSPGDMPVGDDELAEAWAKMQAAWEAYRKAVAPVAALLGIDD
jgi:hypothetical protein